jgi:hypothetical protein
MDKSEANKKRDELRHIGKRWVRLPEQDKRTASGVVFVGAWMTDREYLAYCARRGRKP